MFIKQPNVEVLGFIPARGGSKGIPRKNLMMIAGKPLIVWTIEAALRSSLLSAVIVSTDDPEIAEVARQAGAHVPFMRPTELAQDDTPGVDPVLHALEQLPQYHSVLLLQPTSPLRNTEDIDACLRLAMQAKKPSVVSVTEADNHPYWTYRLSTDRTMTRFLDAPRVDCRQDLPAAFSLNGSLYFSEANWLRRNRNLIGPETLAFVMPKIRSFEVDSLLDSQIVEYLLKASR